MLLESGEAISGAAVWCWQALLFKAPGNGWICGLSQVLITCPPTSFDGPDPIRFTDGEALFDYLLREWAEALGSRPSPGGWIEARDRLRAIDEHVALGFERAMKSRAISPPRSTKGAKGPKSSEPSTTIAGLADIEARLFEVADWKAAAKNALRVLHQQARREALQRKGTDASLGPHEDLERNLFGDPSWLMEEHDEHGQGFSASLMDGTAVDIFKIAGIDPSDDLHDRVWGNHNWQSILDECDAALCIEVGEQDDRPMMSDTFYWVSVDDPIELARQLREFIVLKA